MNARHRRARVAIVGIDGFVPAVADAFVNAGAMPALAALKARGASLRLVSTVPATTPVAWAAMATGCHPDVNGIEGFLLHRSGRQLGDRLSGITSDRMTAEPIWDTVALNGRKAFVVKFPLSYPSMLPALRVDGAAGWGGVTCMHEVAQARTSRVGKGLESAAAWGGTPPEEMHGEARFGRVTLPTLWGGPPLILHVGAVQPADGSVPRLAIALRPSWDTVVCRTALASVSESFQAIAHGRNGPEPVALRCKLIDWKPEPQPDSWNGIALFTTAAHATSGHSHPASTFARHAEFAGPIEEECDPELLFAGDIDLETHYERSRLSAEWLMRISRSILTREDWDLFMVQAHFIDWAHHVLEGALDARHPLHNAGRKPEAQALLRAFYVLADELIATVAEAAGQNANLFVMGDHGQDLHHTTFRANQWLREEGLLFGGVGDAPFDWTRSKALALGNSVYLNVVGREPEGIVSACDATALAERIARGLMALADPRTSERPVLIAAPKEHFAWLGAAGQGMGDCVFFLASGYQARNDAGPLFKLTQPWCEFTSGHDHFWPLDPRIHTALHAAGPDIAASSAPLPLASIIDVAPTLCAIMGIDPPFHARGRVLDSLLGRRMRASDTPTEVAG